MAEQQEKLIEVENLVTYFPIFSGVFQNKTGEVKAVDNISFFIRKGETLGLVGESGCGKTTTGRSILKLEEPTSGNVIFEGKNLIEMKGEGLRKMRAKMQGQRQRIGIARALSASPSFIVCDEAVSALDVSIQGQIIKLLIKLREELNLTYLFISHDLSVVRHISDRVAVMYLGKIVEITTSDNIYSNPKHPYTKSLLSAVPIPDPIVDRKRTRIMLKGDVPSPINPPKGCPFHTRCQMAVDSCRTSDQKLKNMGEEHWVACDQV